MLGTQASPIAPFQKGLLWLRGLSRIESDGRPKPDSERWAVGMGPLREFSLSAYLKSLSKRKGRILSSDRFCCHALPCFVSKAKIITGRSALWLREGPNRLPPSVGSWRFTADHSCTALILNLKRVMSKERPVPQFQAGLLRRPILSNQGVASLGK